MPSPPPIRAEAKDGTHREPRDAIPGEAPVMWPRNAAADGLTLPADLTTEAATAPKPCATVLAVFGVSTASGPMWPDGETVAATKQDGPKSILALGAGANLNVGFR